MRGVPRRGVRPAIRQPRAAVRHRVSRKCAKAAASAPSHSCPGTCDTGPPSGMSAAFAAPMSSMKERAGVKGCGHGPRLVCRRVAGCGLGEVGGVPVIHPVALGGPECHPVLGGSVKRSAVRSRPGDRASSPEARGKRFGRAGRDQPGVVDHAGAGMKTVALAARPTAAGARPSRRPAPCWRRP